MAIHETHRSAVDAGAFFALVLILAALATICVDAYAVTYVL